MLKMVFFFTRSDGGLLLLRRIHVYVVCRLVGYVSINDVYVLFWTVRLLKQLIPKTVILFSRERHL